ncbi:MAG: hypothetical protein ACKOB4_10000, partial [Acidobacteriota bacterium]
MLNRAGVWGALLLLLVGLVGGAEGQTRRRAGTTGRPAATKLAIPVETKAALDRITAESMRGHLAFLASDLLEGRNTPSTGLDIAAEYLAAQMMRAGLQPAVEEGGRRSYFQIARWQLSKPDLESFELSVVDGGTLHRIEATRVSLQTEQAVEAKGLPLLRIDVGDPAALAGLNAEQVRERAVIIELPELPREDRSRMMEAFQARTRIINSLAALKPALILSISRRAEARGLGSGRLIDPEAPAGRMGGGPRMDQILTVHDPRLVGLFDAMKSGETRGAIT